MLKSKLELATNLDEKLFFSIPKIYMDAQPPDMAPLEPLVATDMRVEEDEATVDGTSSTEE